MVLGVYSTFNFIDKDDSGKVIFVGMKQILSLILVSLVEVLALYSEMEVTMIYIIHTHFCKKELTKIFSILS